MKTVLIDLTALRTPRRTGGIGRHVRELALGLGSCVADHPDLRVIGLTRLDPSGGFAVSEDLRAVADCDPQALQTASNTVATWARRLALFRAIRSVGADLVHLPDADGSPWILSGAKVVLTCHDLADLSDYEERGLRDRCEQLVQKPQIARRYRAAEHVIAISSCTAEDLRVRLGVDSSRISVIYNGVDLARWSWETQLESDAQVKGKWGLDGLNYALYVGDARWRKNRRGMLQGLAKARSMAPGLDLQLVWAGALSASEEAIIDGEAASLGLSRAVHRIGFVSDSDLSSVYRGAAAHLFVSRYEGFGLTVVEAMASGCPVITTRRTSLAEVAGDAALVVDPDDFHGIGEALVRVSSDPALRSDLRTRGLRRAQRFSHLRQAKETLATYQRLLRDVS